MPFRKSRSVPQLVAVWLVVGMGLFVLSGCSSEEGVSTYTVPRELPMGASRTDDKAGQRVVGVIIPRDKETWFFKMTGPDTVVGPQVEAFEKFLTTVRFPDGKPIEWTKPDDWGKKPEQGIRYSTLLVGPRQLELTVIKLGPLGNEGDNSLLGNVNRWRTQIGLERITAPELEKTTKRIKVGGLDATLVDATRPGLGGNEGPSRGNELKYQAPDDWKKAPNDQFSKLKFTLARDGKTATVSFSQLTPQDLMPNVERWRIQVGLPPKFPAEELPKMASSLELPLAKADYVDVSGSSKRLLGVLLHKDQETWVFKLLGDRELVGSQKSAFEEFVKSVRLE